MARKKNKKKKRPDWQAPSAVLLAARLQTGAGKHADKRRGTRSTDRRRAIEEHS
jgi:hypothetical protein